MGGKGIRRRAKNYKEAHGGYRRLPPPPDRSQPDTLPSKLRKILSYTTPQGFDFLLFLKLLLKFDVVSIWDWFCEVYVLDGFQAL